MAGATRLPKCGEVDWQDCWHKQKKKKPAMKSKWIKRLEIMNAWWNLATGLAMELEISK